MISPDVLVASQFIATNGFRVSRVSYSSPIDILIIGAGVLTSGVPASYLALRRVIKLFNETSDARIKFAEARIKEADASMKEAEARIKESDVAVLTALNNRTLQALSTAQPGSNLDRVDPDLVERRALEKPIRQRVEEAASVLMNAERIAVEPGH